MTYIGYPSLEAWARSVVRKLPVYACLVEEPQPPDSHGIQAVLLVIWVGQHRPQEQEIHYFRCRVGLLEYLGKSPLGTTTPIASGGRRKRGRSSGRGFVSRASRCGRA